MRAFVPFFKRRGNFTFPTLAPVTVMPVVTPAMSHAAEEEHLHCTEEQEEEEDRATDRTKGIKEVRMTKTVHMRVAISVPMTIHRQDGRASFYGFFNSI